MVYEWETFAQFGLGGMILAVFFFLVMMIVRLHAKTIERMSKDHLGSSEAWRMTFESHSNRADNRQAETNAVLRDLTKVISDNNNNHQRLYQDAKICRPTQ